MDYFGRRGEGERGVCLKLKLNLDFVLIPAPQRYY